VGGGPSPAIRTRTAAAAARAMLPEEGGVASEEQPRAVRLSGVAPNPGCRRSFAGDWQSTFSVTSAASATFVLDSGGTVDADSRFRTAPMSKLLSVALPGAPATASASAGSSERRRLGVGRSGVDRSLSSAVGCLARLGGVRGSTFDLLLARDAAVWRR